MKSALRLSLFGLIVLSLASCSWQRKEDNFNGPVRAQIPFAINGQYSLRIVDLLTLTNLEHLEGSAAKFLLEPSVQAGRLHGAPPSIRYIRNTNGVVVPKDDISLQLLTVYAHIERLQDLDSKVGAQGVLRYPRTVAVNAEYRTDEGELENNALYSGQYDTLLFVPYTQSALPIMANGGIIGHEHFHALFHKLVIEPLGKKYPNYQEPTPHPDHRLQEAMGLSDLGLTAMDRSKTRAAATPGEIRERYHAMVLRGVNEGLADVWGWIYSGDTNFVGKSLPEEKLNRNLDSTPEMLNSQEWLMEWVSRSSENSPLLGMSYSLGNQIARAFKGLVQTHLKTQKSMSAVQSRIEIGKLLLRVMPQLKKKFASLKEDEFLNPSFVLSESAIQFVEFKSLNQCAYLLKLVPEKERDPALEQICQVGRE